MSIEFISCHEVQDLAYAVPMRAFRIKVRERTFLQKLFRKEGRIREFFGEGTCWNELPNFARVPSWLESELYRFWKKASYEGRVVKQHEKGKEQDGHGNNS